MSYSDEPKQNTQTSTTDMTAAEDKLVLTPTNPVEVLEFGFIVTTALVDNAGDGMVAKMDYRPTAASDAGRGDGDIGTLTLTKAQAVSLAAGDVVRTRLASPYTVLPGEQAVLQLTDAVATSGNAIPFIVFRNAPKTDRAASKELVVTE